METKGQFPKVKAKSSPVKDKLITNSKVIGSKKKAKLPPRLGGVGV
jgi:hypothetical protein